MRPDEHLTSGGEVRELTPQEIEAAEREDPDVALITDYLTGSLTPEEARVVEDRLQNDPAFHASVGTIVEAWRAWPTARDFSLPEDELAPEARRFREDGERLLRAADTARRLRDETTSDREDARDGARTGRQGGRRSGMHSRDRSDDRAARAESRRAIAIRQEQRRTRRWQLAAGFLGVVLLPAAIWGTMRLTKPLPPPQLHMIRPVAENGVSAYFGDQGMAMVDAGARLIWDDSARVNGSRELLLEGGAQFFMREARAGLFVVVTPSARIVVMGSDFRVTAVDPGVTEVRVESGRVLLKNRGGDPSDALEVRAGERGRAGWREPPVRAY